jgi:hypothetical protein
MAIAIHMEHGYPTKAVSDDGQAHDIAILEDGRPWWYLRTTSAIEDEITRHVRACRARQRREALKGIRRANRELMHCHLAAGWDSPERLAARIQNSMDDLIHYSEQIIALH